MVVVIQDPSLRPPSPSPLETKPLLDHSTLEVLLIPTLESCWRTLLVQDLPTRPKCMVLRIPVKRRQQKRSRRSGRQRRRRSRRLVERGHLPSSASLQDTDSLDTTLTSSTLYPPYHTSPRTFASPRIPLTPRHVSTPIPTSPFLHTLRTPSFHACFLSLLPFFFSIFALVYRIVIYRRPSIKELSFCYATESRKARDERETIQ